MKIVCWRFQKRWVKILESVTLASLVGCTQLASGTDRGEPLMTAPPPDPAWDCLSEPPKVPDLPANPPDYIAFVVPIFDVAHPPSAVPDLKVEACQVSDADCTAPLPAPAYSRMDVPQPGVPVPIPTYIIVFPYTPMITWYLKLTTPPPADPKAFPDYLPFEYYFEGPLVQPNGDPLPNGIPAVYGQPINMLSAKDADRFAAGIKQTRDTTAAIIALRAMDCTGTPAAGVRLTLDPNVGIPFTFLSSLALSTDPPAPTDASGILGFANIPLPLPNTTSLTPTVTLQGISPDSVNYGEIAARIRPGQVTSGEIRPFPTLSGR